MDSGPFWGWRRKMGSRIWVWAAGQKTVRVQEKRKGEMKERNEKDRRNFSLIMSDQAELP
jgi:hypothetical protein